MPNQDEVLASLKIDFRIKVVEVIRICKDQGVTILPYCGLRTCAEQARLFRKTRTPAEVAQRVQSLRDRGFTALAQILIDIGPQPGKLGVHLTKAGPGESWHQYAEAVDCVPLSEGKATWKDDSPEWEVYGAAATHVGLSWAGSWKSFPELPHIQLRTGNQPLQTASIENIMTMLRDCGSL